MKKAVPVRMPEWSEGHFPTSKQLQTYLFYGRTGTQKLGGILHP
jgi:hypothetical protein